MNTKENLINHFEEHIIKLAELKLIPLSTQLKRITGDTFNTIDFKNLNNEKEVSPAAGNIIIHIKTGLKFLIP